MTLTPPPQSLPPAAARDRRVHLAAYAVFAKRGLDVPLAEVAKAADVGVATLYRRYKDKDALILEVYREQILLKEQLSVEANAFSSAWDGLVYFLHRTTEQFTQDRGLRELILGGYVDGAGWARGSSHQELHDALNALHRRVLAQLDLLVALAKEQKAVRDDFESIDVLLMSAMAHTTAPTRASGQPLTGQRALQLLIEGIRPSM